MDNIGECRRRVGYDIWADEGAFRGARDGGWVEVYYVLEAFILFKYFISGAGFHQKVTIYFPYILNTVR